MIGGKKERKGGREGEMVYLYINIFIKYIIVL